MEPSTVIERPKASDLQAPDERIRDNRARWTMATYEECFLCGRGLTEASVNKGWWINLGTDGTLLPEGYFESADYDATLDQGAFPVGSECAKKIHRPFKFKRVTSG